MKDTLDHFLEGNKALAKQSCDHIQQYAMSEEGDPLPLEELKACVMALEAIIQMAQDAQQVVHDKMLLTAQEEARCTP